MKHKSNILLSIVLIMSAIACTSDDACTLCVDDMLNIDVIPAQQIEATLNGEKCELTGARLCTSASYPEDMCQLSIGGLTPNASLYVPVSVNARNGHLNISGETAIGAYSDLNVTGTFDHNASGKPHLVLDIRYRVNSRLTSRPYVFDLSNNLFNVMYYYSGSTEIDGVEIDNAEAVRISSEAINRELSKNGKKIRLTFDPSGILTVDAMARGSREWQPIHSARYWMTSDEYESMTIGLSDNDKVMLCNLWFDEPLDADKHIYYSSLPITINLHQRGDYAYMTITHILQTHLLCGYIDYKMETGGWTQQELQSLKVLVRLINNDYQKYGANSSLWALSASHTE